MKIRIPARTPRNPLVALARARAAGRHGPSAKATRLRERQALRRACRGDP